MDMNKETVEDLFRLLIGDEAKVEVKSSGFKDMEIQQLEFEKLSKDLEIQELKLQNQKLIKEKDLEIQEFKLQNKKELAILKNDLLKANEIIEKQRSLLSHFIKLIKNNETYGVLHQACKDGNTKLVELLLQIGFSVSVMTLTMKSMRHLFMLQPNMDIVKSLKLFSRGSSNIG